MARHVVARTTDIPAGGNKVVSVEGREIVVFNVNGEFFALLNRCPHEGAPLAKAACVAHLESDEPGEYRRSRIGEMLRCAWHGWEFDMRTGQSYFDPQHTRIRSYPGRDRGWRDAGQGPLRRRDVPGDDPGELRAGRNIAVPRRMLWRWLAARLRFPHARLHSSQASFAPVLDIP